MEGVQARPLKQAAVLSPLVDFLMVGGISLIMLPLFLLLVPANQDIHKISVIMFYLAFVVNYPHFLISYQFLYVDHFGQITKNWRMCLAGIVVPVLMLAYLAFAAFEGSQVLLGYMAKAMFFLVGHHYIKQVLGCVVVISAFQKISFDKWERRIITLNMYALWMISFLSANTGIHSHDFYGLKYQTSALPTWSISACYATIGLSLLIFACQVVYKYIQTGKWIPFNAVVAFCSIYAWHIPVFYHPSYFYMIPFFHSLQYMLFALAYVKNRTRPEAIEGDSAKYRKKWVLGMLVYVLASVILGTLFFDTIPTWLDQLASYDRAILGSTFFMFAFVIFINIHHYFIDFAIWKRDNPKVRQYLFG